MALLAAVGFETNTLTVGVENAGLSFPNGSTTLSLVSSPVHTGTVALQGAMNSTGANYVITGMSTSHSRYSKTSFRVSVLPNVESMMMEDGSNNGVFNAFITIGTDGKLRVYYSDPTSGFDQVGSASSALSLNTWYDVELHVDDTAGLGSLVVEARLNESVFATGTVSSFTSSNGVASGQVCLDCYAYNGGTFSGGTSGTWFFDDFVVTDITGTSMTGYPGAVQLARLTPNAAGDSNTFATQTGGTAGAANNFTRVDETTPDSATTFNGSSTLNQVDLFKCNDPALTGNTINFVQALAFFRNSTADATGTAKLEIEKAAAGTIAQGGAIIANSTTFKTTTLAQSLILYKDPDNGTWTETTLATMQLGYKLTVAPGTAGRRTDISTVWAYVGYTPTPVVNTSHNLALLGVGT